MEHLNKQEEYKKINKEQSHCLHKQHMDELKTGNHKTMLVKMKQNAQWKKP